MSLGQVQSVESAVFLSGALGKFIFLPLLGSRSGPLSLPQSPSSIFKDSEQCGSDNFSLYIWRVLFSDLFFLFFILKKLVITLGLLDNPKSYYYLRVS